MRQAIRSLDARLCHKWATFTTAKTEDGDLTDDKKELSLIFDTAYSWNNLVNWCKAIHDPSRATSSYALSERDSDPFFAVVYAAHQKALRCRSREICWNECKEALDDLYHVVAALDPSWGTGNETN